MVKESTTAGGNQMGWAGTYQPPVQTGRCPCCGACLHCGHIASPQPPWYPYIGDWPVYPPNGITWNQNAQVPTPQNMMLQAFN